MKDILRLGVILSGIYIVAALALGSVNQITAPVIEDRNIQANNESRQIVLSDAQEFKMVEGISDDIVVEVYEGLASGEVVGYTIKTLPKGYGGAMEVMVGISTDGKVTGINIGNHAETPGLGSKAAEPAFKDQFVEKDAKEPLDVVKGSKNKESDIQAISGATITSQAVTNGVNAAMQIFNQELGNK